MSLLRRYYRKEFRMLLCITCSVASIVTVIGGTVFTNGAHPVGAALVLASAASLAYVF